MELAEIANFFTVVVGFSSIGFVLDQLSRSLRAEQLSRFEKPSTTKLLQIYFHTIHVRVFGEQLLSRAFIFRSLFAYIFLLFLSFLFIFFLNDLDASFLNRGISALFYISLVCGFFTFLITLAQTQTFIRAAIYSSAGSSKVVFIAADLLLSVNIFVFTYSFFAAIALNFYWTLYASPALIDSSRNLIIEYSVNESPPNTSSLQYRHVIQVYTELGGDRDEQLSSIGFVIQSQIETLPLMPLIADYVDEDTTFHVTEALGGENTFDIEAGVNRLDSFLAEDDIGWGASGREIIISGPIGGYIGNTLPATYARTFIEVDDVEDQFLAIFSPRLLYFDSMRAFGISSSFIPFDREPYCFTNGRILSAAFSSEPLYAEADCLEATEIISGTLRNRWHVRASGALGAFEGPMVLSPIYFSALLPSIAFYSIVASSLILLGARSFFSNTKIGAIIYESVPFSFGFLIVGLLLATFVSI